MCPACATERLITRPFALKVKNEVPIFLDRIQGDISGPIQSLLGPFRYFMVLIDASSKWSHVCLLSTRNHAFAKLIRMDNAGELTSKAFHDYCMAMEIKVEHSILHVNTQNRLAAAFI